MVAADTAATEASRETTAAKARIMIIKFARCLKGLEPVSESSSVGVERDAFEDTYAARTESCKRRRRRQRGKLDPNLGINGPDL